MTIDNRAVLRNNVIETLLATFSGAQKVTGGIAFLSDTLDEETGRYFPVEVRVTVKNTADTARGTAFDLDAAVAEYAAKPGKKRADPEKAAQEAVRKEAAAARKVKNLEILRNWLATATVQDMTTSEIYASIPEFSGETLMYVGGLLKALTETGELTKRIENKKPYYTK